MATIVVSLCVLHGDCSSSAGALTRTLDAPAVGAARGAAGRDPDRNAGWCHFPRRIASSISAIGVMALRAGEFQTRRSIRRWAISLWMVEVRWARGVLVAPVAASGASPVSE